MANSVTKVLSSAKWSKIIDDYERIIEPFTALWASNTLLFACQRILDAIKNLIDQSAKFVDVGCGTGVLCLAFAEKYLSSPPTQGTSSSPMKGIQIIATDLVDGMLARVDEKLDARLRYQHFRSQIKTMQMDGQLLDKLADASVDIIGSSFGLSIFPDRVKAWGSAARVLKTDGVLFVTVWDSQSPNLRWADASAKLAYETQLAAKDVNDKDSEPSQLFVPSSKVGHVNIVSELRAAGFRDIEMYRSQHSVTCEIPIMFANENLDGPFIDFIGHIVIATK